MCVKASLLLVLLVDSAVTCWTHGDTPIVAVGPALKIDLALAIKSGNLWHRPGWWLGKHETHCAGRAATAAARLELTEYQ